MKRLSCFLVIIVVACFSVFAHAEEARKPVIVCSLPVLADFVKQVVGDDCEVKSLTEAGTDPHEYQPKPADAEIIKSADLCVENGLHMEGGGEQQLDADSGQRCRKAPCHGYCWSQASRID